jgi:hypothetical protein
MVYLIKSKEYFLNSFEKNCVCLCENFCKGGKRDLSRAIKLLPEFCTGYRSEAPKTLCLKGSWSHFDSQA